MASIFESENIVPLIGSEYFSYVVPLIDNAKESIKILMFDWRWYPNGLGSPVQEFNQSLVRASRRGVSVRCVVNCDGIVETLAKLGIKAKKYNSKNLLHSKLLILDKQAVVIGSHNISSNAFESNVETSVVVFNEKVADHFSNFFEKICLL